MVDRLETLEINTIAAIIDNYISHQKKDGMVACFVFAVLVKLKAEEGAIQNADIIKVLPPIDDVKTMLYDERFRIGVIVTGDAILGILCGIIFFEKALYVIDRTYTKIESQLEMFPLARISEPK